MSATSKSRNRSRERERERGREPPDKLHICSCLFAISLWCRQFSSALHGFYLLFLLVRFILLPSHSFPLYSTLSFKSYCIPQKTKPCWNCCWNFCWKLHKHFQFTAIFDDSLKEHLNIIFRLTFANWNSETLDCTLRARFTRFSQPEMSVFIINHRLSAY